MMEVIGIMLVDPIENTKEYKKAMKKIQRILDKEFPKSKYHFGICHRIWRRKKQLLAEAGIEWKTPVEMNPDVRFD